MWETQCHKPTLRGWRMALGLPHYIIIIYIYVYHSLPTDHYLENHELYVYVYTCPLSKMRQHTFTVPFLKRLTSCSDSEPGVLQVTLGDRKARVLWFPPQGGLKLLAKLSWFVHVYTISCDNG